MSQLIKSLTSWLKNIFRSKPRSQFAETPQYFHKKVIRFSAKVEKILPGSIRERVKRKLIDKFRTLIGSSNPVGRHVHQRFIVSSPALYPDENMLVFHNIKFGKVSVGEGSWLDIQGVYIHSTSVVKTWYGLRETRYGRVHYTHEPKGHLRVLKEKPKAEELQSVRIS